MSQVWQNFQLCYIFEDQSLSKVTIKKDILNPTKKTCYLQLILINLKTYSHFIFIPP